MRVSEDLVRRVVEEIIAETRQPAPPRASVTTPRGAELPVLAAGEAPSRDYCMACVEQERKRARKRAVLTTTGKNRKGIVATITQAIAHAGGDILDISQTLISDYFTMIIVVDTASLDGTLEQFGRAVTEAARSVGCETLMMHEDVMTALHRV